MIPAAYQSRSVDINTRIPREEVGDIFQAIKDIGRRSRIDARQSLMILYPQQGILTRSLLSRLWAAIAGKAIRPWAFGRYLPSPSRGKADCGDIDILVTRPTDDKKSHSGMVQRIVNKCQEYGIIVDHLSIPRNWWNLELVYHGLCRRDENSPVRRLGTSLIAPGEILHSWASIDFLAVPYENRGAALLYFTGDDIVSVLLIGYRVCSDL